MKLPLGALTLALTTGLFAPDLNAEDWFAPVQKIEKAPADHSNWFSLGPQLGLKMNVRFNHVGSLNPASAGPATGGGLNRSYGDGFVNVDSSGNAGGQTWNWGYQNASQVQGGTLTMHGAAVNGTLSRNGDPNPGFDVAFGRHLGTVLGGKWGLQGALDFTTVSINDSHSVSGMGTLISDSFSLGVVTPPQAPYSGSFNGPGPLLGDAPTRTTVSTTVMVNGQRTLEAQVCTLRAGPYYEFPLGRRWSGRLGGGLALAVANTRYSYNEMITFGTGAVVNSAGSSSGAEFHAGGYLEGKLLYAVSPGTSFFAGAQYEYLGTFSRNAGSEQAQLDMGSTVHVLFGVQFDF